MHSEVMWAGSGGGGAAAHTALSEVTPGARVHAHAGSRHTSATGGVRTAGILSGVGGGHVIRPVKGWQGREGGTGGKGEGVRLGEGWMEGEVGL